MGDKRHTDRRRASGLSLLWLLLVALCNVVLMLHTTFANEATHEAAATRSAAPTPTAEVTSRLPSKLQDQPAAQAQYPRLITYAHNCCTAAKKRCCKTGLQFGFKSCVALGQKDVQLGLLSPAGRDTFLNGTRGAGYWIWKPAIILQALLEAKDGDLIMYSDAGAAFVSDVSPLLKLTDEQDVVGFQLTCCKEGEWTKTDTFMLLDGLEFADTQQVLASYIVFKRNWTSIAFVSQWLAYAQDPRALTDEPSTLSVLPQPNSSSSSSSSSSSNNREITRQLSSLKGKLQDHRHDQSIFSLLYKKWRFKAHPIPSQYGRKGTAALPYPQIILHHRELN